MLEPRGHRDMYGAVLTEPASPGSHAGVLFMHSDGFSSMCGHGIVAVVTIALERGIIVPGGDGRSLTFDTPAGTVRATAFWEEERPGGRERKVERVAFLNVPSFVVHGWHRRRASARAAFAPTSPLAGRSTRSWTANRSACRSMRHTSLSCGVSASRSRTRSNERRRLRIRSSRGLTGIQGTIFTGPPRDSSADLRNVTVFANGAIDRSASGTGTAAVMTVIDAMGLLDDQRPFVHESIVGTTFTGRVAGADDGGRVSGDRSRDSGLSVDHRRAHVHRRSERSAEERFYDLSVDRVRS